MRNFSKPSRFTALLGLAVVALPLVASAALPGSGFDGNAPIAQVSNIPTAPGHVNNWPGAHNSNLRGQAE